MDNVKQASGRVARVRVSKQLRNAAHDLLAACEAVVENLPWPDDYPEGSGERAALEAVRAAIAKAKEK